MVLGLVMFCVAAVFIINMANAKNRVSDIEAGYWNLGFGIITLFLVCVGIIQQWNGDGTFWWAAQTLMFSLTYLFMGIVKLAKLDGRGMGWWCLFVTINIPYPAYQTFMSGDIRLGLIWVSWGVLWFMFFVLMGLQKGGEKLAKAIFIYEIPLLIFTLWLPGILFLNNMW